MKEEVKQISSRIFDWEGLYYSNSSIWLWWLSNIVKTCTCSYEVPQSHRQGNPDNPETVQIETLFWKISFFLFFSPLIEEKPNLRCNCTTTNIGCFLNHLQCGSSRQSKRTWNLSDRLHQQISSNSKFQISQPLQTKEQTKPSWNLPFLYNVHSQNFKRYTKQNLILPKQKKLSVKRAEVGMKPIYLGEWIKKNWTL